MSSGDVYQLGGCNWLAQEDDRVDRQYTWLLALDVRVRKIPFVSLQELCYVVTYGRDSRII